MSKFPPIMIFIFLLGIMTFKCTPPPKGPLAESTPITPESIPDTTAIELTQYDVNTATSGVQWTGTNISAAHFGSLSIKKGILYLHNFDIVRGNFDIDMNSLAVSDLQGEEKKELENHLKDGDFFETNKFPTASFEITKSEPITDDPSVTHMITGNLTIKNISRSISFPINMTLDEGQLSVITTAFTIDRTEWGIVYKSSALNTAKDKLINDKIGLVIHFEAFPASGNE